MMQSISNELNNGIDKGSINAAVNLQLGEIMVHSSVAVEMKYLTTNYRLDNIVRLFIVCLLLSHQVGSVLHVLTINNPQ